MGYRYPESSARAEGWLAVDARHAIHYSERGSPDGVPVVEIHGGPGVGTVAEFTRIYDPARYRIVTFDQRGAGRSTPSGELRDNTTAHLIDDMEALRRHLNIERWLLSGWSWGTTLALVYAQQHPERVLGLVLRGAWTALPEEAEWFSAGLQNFFPDTLDRLDLRDYDVPREQLLGEILRRAADASLDPALRERAAADYGRYELRACYLEATDERIARDLAAGPQLPVAMIGSHYWEHQWFLRPRQLWSDLSRITHLPCALIHGRYDAVAVPRISYELHRAWPGSELYIVERAGHMTSEPPIAALATQVLDRLAARLAGVSRG
jgi:proline iminopeptidase